MKMSALAACRMCLALDIRMYAISDTPLQEIYEKMTNILLENEDGKPVLACYICHYKLRKCQDFLEKSVKADHHLQQILSSGLEITEKSISMLNTKLSTSLCVTPIDIVSCEVEDNAFVPVKVEDVPIQVKLETDAELAEDTPEDAMETEDLPHMDSQDHSSSSEDDLPLKTFSVKKSTIRKPAKPRKDKVLFARKKKNGEEKCKFLPDVSEIILSKEEQMAQLLERAKSLNYISSPYKCNLCYKGFINARAFQNHNEKHDERYGTFVCEICRMRYRTPRHLRTHEVASHERQYLCNKCGHRAHTVNQAREHDKWHKGHTYDCQLCSETFRKSTSYLTHMRKRHPTEHVCEICGESFVGKHGLHMHKTKTHWREDEKSVTEQDSEPASFCVECNIRFRSVDAWKRHVVTSLKHALGNENSVTCLACNEVVSGSALLSHVKKHVSKPAKPPPAETPGPNLPCEQCEKSFVTRAKLHAHVKKVHLGYKYDKNLVCEVCGKKCTSFASLAAHQRTHSGERPHSCPQCSRGFRDNNQLRIHQRTHSGERPYACSLCPKKFSQKPALNRHYRVHTGAKPYSCPFCAKSFSQSNSRKLHVSSVHFNIPKRTKVNKEQPKDL